MSLPRSCIIRPFSALDIGKDAMADSRSIGYAGLVGSVLILFAFLSVMCAGLDPTTDLRSWFVLSFELIGGLAISAAFGFKLANKRASMETEFSGVILGIFVGVIILGMEYALLTADYFLSVAQGIWLTMLAPVAETMLIVAIYHIFRFHFPELTWILLAIPTDVIFAMLHWYAYGMRPDFILIEIILALGNTLLVYSYHLTKNATVPMVGHLMINIAPNSGAVLTFIATWAWLFVILFMVFLFLYLTLGRSHR